MTTRDNGVSRNARMNWKKFRRDVGIIARVSCFVGILVALLYGSTELCQNVCRLSPLLFLASHSDESEFAGKVAEGIMIASFAIVFFCLICRRFFCKYVCPLGLALDVCNWFRRRLFINALLRNGLPIVSKPVFTFFATLWVLSLAFFHLPQRFDHQLEGFTPLIFDPLAVFSQTIVRFPKPMPVFAAFILSFIVSPYFWRHTFCPCGAAQELLYLPFSVARKLFKKQNKSTESQQKRRSRRIILKAVGATALGGAAFAAINKLGTVLKPVFFRPPGARMERDFLARCARCGRCVAACPNKVVKPLDLEQAKQASNSLFQACLIAETPIVNLNNACCEKECVACSKACPTGAIAPITILDKPNYPIATAQFELEKCLLYYGRECSICRRECPYDAIAFVWSDDAYANVPAINPNVCVGCGRCVVYCPGEPSFDETGNSSQENDLERSIQQGREKALKLVPRQF